MGPLSLKLLIFVQKLRIMARHLDEDEHFTILHKFRQFEYYPLIVAYLFVKLEYSMKTWNVKQSLFSFFLSNHLPRKTLFALDVVLCRFSQSFH